MPQIRPHSSSKAPGTEVKANQPQPPPDRPETKGSRLDADASANFVTGKDEHGLPRDPGGREGD